MIREHKEGVASSIAATQRDEGENLIPPLFFGFPFLVLFFLFGPSPNTCAKTIFGIHSSITFHFLSC